MVKPWSNLDNQINIWYNNTWVITKTRCIYFLILFVCRWWVRSWSSIPEEHHQQWGNDPSQSYCSCKEDPWGSCLKTGRVIDIFGGSVFRDVVVTLTHRGLHQLFCIFGPQIESSNKIFLKLNKVQIVEFVLKISM